MCYFITGKKQVFIYVRQGDFTKTKQFWIIKYKMWTDVGD